MSDPEDIDAGDAADTDVGHAADVIEEGAQDVQDVQDVQGAGAREEEVRAHGPASDESAASASKSRGVDARSDDAPAEDPQARDADDDDDDEDEDEHDRHDEDGDEDHHDPHHEDDTRGPRGRRRRTDSLFRETLRRAVEKGVETSIGTFTKADSAFRGVVDDVKLPKEVASVLFSQVDETKNALVKGVAREVRDFLEATDVANEFYRALTSLSFEIKTEIRFIPNDSGGVKPEVKAKVAPKRDKRWRRKRGSDGDDDDGGQS